MKKQKQPPNNCLFLLDCKNLLLSVKSLYGTDARLNFKLLLEIAFRNPEHKEIGRNSASAYVDLGSQWLTSLAHVLSTVGYKLRTYGPHIGEESLICPYMMIDCLAQYYLYNKITIASGRGDLVPMYEFLSTKGKEVEVIAFPHDMSSQVSKYVTRIVELDETVLWTDLREAKPSV